MHLALCGGGAVPKGWIGSLAGTARQTATLRKIKRVKKKESMEDLQGDVDDTCSRGQWVQMFTFLMGFTHVAGFMYSPFMFIMCIFCAALASALACRGEDIRGMPIGCLKVTHLPAFRGFKIPHPSPSACPPALSLSCTPRLRPTWLISPPQTHTHMHGAIMAGSGHQVPHHWAIRHERALPGDRLRQDEPLGPTCALRLPSRHQPTALSVGWDWARYRSVSLACP